jgi:large subunit ribosomal protein L23
MAGMSNDRLYQVIRAPHVSEKTTRIQGESNQYVFEVSSDATKPEIKAAVEHLFKVKVSAVQVMTVKGKEKAFKQRAGSRSDWRKAYVRVSEGQAIDFGVKV